MIRDPKLYALVIPGGNLGTSARGRHRSKAVIQTELLAELRTNKAIDRADAMLTKLEARAKVCARQIAVLQKRKANALARAERIEQAILERMEQAKLSKADGFEVVLTTKDAPPSVIVDDAALVPPQYIRTTEAVDKAAVKAALARGMQIAGVRLVQGVSLQRKRG
jgi:phage host-nuclease inhibitor protein Gam